MVAAAAAAAAERRKELVVFLSCSLLADSFVSEEGFPLLGRQQSLASLSWQGTGTAAPLLWSRREKEIFNTLAC